MRLGAVGRVKEGRRGGWSQAEKREGGREVQQKAGSEFGCTAHGGGGSAGGVGLSVTMEGGIGAFVDGEVSKVSSMHRIFAVKLRVSCFLDAG